MASIVEDLCVDCKQTVCTKNDLQCKKHIICKDCLVKRVQKSQSVDECMVCCCKHKEFDPSYSYKDAVLHDSESSQEDEVEVRPKTGTCTPFDSTMPGIWIFVDDSNIWIEAKKLQSKQRRFKTSEDHRVRIDTGKLADLIANGRSVHKGILYGSEPPPVDTVWEKIRQKGWKVRSQRRSAITGKEKQVDTKLVADVTELAIDTPVQERTTIALVTGDADVIPALDKIISRERWKIEIYMWRQAIARSLTKYASEHKERVEIKHLDAYLGKTTFTSMKFPIKNRQLLSVVKECGIVLSMVPNAFGNRIPDKAWCNELESIAQWPFQYYWFEYGKKKTDHLVLIFSNDRGRRFNITEFLATINPLDSEYHLPKVTLAVTFLTFMNETFKKKPSEELQQFDAALEQVGIYKHEDVYAGYENESSWVSDSEEKFSTVHSRKKQKQKYSDPCTFKFNCFNGTSCYYKHEEKEKAYFKRRGGRGNPFRKTEICKFYSPMGTGSSRCMKPQEECDYAHGVEDAWCLQCRQVGHFQATCPKIKRK